MNTRPYPPALGAALCAALSIVAACDGGGYVIVSPDPGPPPIPVVAEVEPNDDAWTAQDLGAIAAWDQFAVEGFVTECCPDPYDGFRVYALEPVEVRLSLFAYEPLADLELAIYDPLEDRIVAAFESGTNPELGEFLLGLPAEFHVVVYSWSGDSAYWLEVEVLPLAGGTGYELDPGDELPAARFVVEEAPSAGTRARLEGYRAAGRAELEDFLRSLSERATPEPGREGVEAQRRERFKLRAGHDEEGAAGSRW